MRELGVGADGYLRKEADAAVVLLRVHDVLQSRLNLEARLRGPGDVRGRLDTVSVTTLLTLTARYRHDATLTLRDVSFLYEIDVRDGTPCKATRTTSEGHFERGPNVLAGALGVEAGRFWVGAPRGKVRGELRGTLLSQLSVPTAKARAAGRLLSDAGLLQVRRIEINLDAVQTYVEATPEPFRTHAQQLAAGQTPRELVLHGEASIGMLEQVVRDLIIHGGIRGIYSTFDEDLLVPAMEHELRVIEGQPTRNGSDPFFDEEPLFEEITPSPLSFLPNLTVADAEASDSTRTSRVRPLMLTPLFVVEEPTLRFSYNDFDFDDMPAPGHQHPVEIPAASPSEPVSWGPPTPLGGIAVSSFFPADPGPAPLPREEPTLPSFRHVAEEENDDLPTSESFASPRFSRSPSAHHRWLMASTITLLSLVAAIVYVRHDLIATGNHSVANVTPSLGTSAAPTLTPPALPASAEPAVAFSLANDAADSALAVESPTLEAKAANSEPKETSLPAGVRVPAGYGLLEIAASHYDSLVINRVEVGRGPNFAMPYPAGVYDVRIRHRGEEQPLMVVVRAGRRTAVDTRSTWKK